MEKNRARVLSTTVRIRGDMTAKEWGRQKTSRQEQVMKQEKEKKEDVLKALNTGERLLRNTAVCVALLLCVLALQAAGKNNQTISKMVSMDLSESLGSLRFVSNFLPESASVFWNMGAERHGAPGDGAVIHTFSSAQPYLQYDCREARASAAGEVMSVSVEPSGYQSLRIRHASGLESVYGGMKNISVFEGDWVEKGQVLGETEVLTYELRGEGRSIDPMPYLE